MDKDKPPLSEILPGMTFAKTKGNVISVVSTASKQKKHFEFKKANKAREVESKTFDELDELLQKGEIVLLSETEAIELIDQKISSTKTLIQNKQKELQNLKDHEEYLLGLKRLAENYKHNQTRAKH